MILNIDTKLSVEEIAEKLGIETYKIEIEGKDFSSQQIYGSDFDDACNDYRLKEYLTKEDKMQFIKELQNNDVFQNEILACIDNEIQESYDELLEKARIRKEEKLKDLDPVTRFRKELMEFCERNDALNEFAFYETYESQRENSPHSFSYECNFSQGGGLYATIEFSDVDDLITKFSNSLPNSVEQMLNNDDYSYDNLASIHKINNKKLFTGIVQLKEFLGDYQQEIENSKGR